MNKKVLIAITGFGLAVGGLTLPLSCEKPPQWTEVEWNSQSGESMPSPKSLSASGAKAKLGAQMIEFREQVVDGIPIQGTYVKSLSTGRQTVWRKAKFLALDNLPATSLVRKELAQQAKARKRIVATQNSLSCKAIGQPNPELRWKRSWILVFKQVCENRKGDALEIVVSSRGKLLSQDAIGASMAMTMAMAVAVGMEDQAATLFPKGPKQSALTPVQVRVSVNPSYLVNSGIEVSSDSGEHFSDLGQIQQTAPGVDQFDMLQAYYYSANALDWVETHTKFRMTGLKLRTQVGFPNKSNVAFYYNREVRIGAGDDVTYSHMAWDPSIVIHETMHGVIDALTRLPLGSGEGGSLQEALADILTALQLDNPQMGEASYMEAPFQRTLASDLKLSDKNGRVYHDSLILSGTLWELRTAIDPATAEDLTVYLLAHLVPSSDFADTKVQIQAWLNSIVIKEKTSAIESVLSKRGWL